MFFFGEPISETVHNSSIKKASLADLFILIETTGEIMPTSMIPFIAKKNGAKFIEINIKKSRYTELIVDIYLQGKASIILRKLKNTIKL